MTKTQRTARLYAPLLALFVLQAFIVVVAPSNRPSDELGLSSGGAFGDDTGGGIGTGGTFDDGSGSGTGADGFSGGTDFGGSAGGSTSGATGGTSSGATGGTGATPTAGGTNPATVSGPAQGATPGATSGPGDTSHCTPDGLQFDILIGSNPRCRAKFTGNNGGATYQGVTDTEIHVIQFQAAPNEQVDAILATQGLAASAEEAQAFYDASMKFIHDNYELYGRKIRLERIVGDCPTTPPDVSKCIAAAQEVVKKKPFMVVWGTSLYDSVFDIWVKAGIVAVGGQHFAERFFNDRRPFRYDALMDGTQSAKHLGEYYCKKMGNKKASHSGRVIHTEVGLRDQVDRRVGISVPEIAANVESAQVVRDLIAKCSKKTPVIVTYASDIERATEQTQATVAKYISEDVTTVICMCDPIAPAFLTAGLSGNNYFPEFLIPGLGLLDYDLLGRLYDKQVMSHAFGPSHLQKALPLAESDAARVWKSVGNDGNPCSSCNLTWAYMSLMASMLHHAGPTLNPVTIENNMLTLPPSGGDIPESTLVKFGPNDYTALSDAREVYWSEAEVSAIDGKPGAYIPTKNGKRYQLGQWTNDLPIPVAPN